jgi:AAA family ATP:ADP antiporter
MKDEQPNLLARLMKSASKIEPHELKSVLVSFVLVFLLMAAWYILRPVRDAMASDWTATEISQLWNINFFVCIAVVAIYGFAVSHIRFAFLVPGTYAFFAATFLGFYFGTSGMGDVVVFTSVLNQNLGLFTLDWEIYLTVDKIFYIWVSVFSLYHVTVFWSFMADLFTKEQSRRLFAFIAAGASAGALAGPLIPTLFAEVMGTDTLMLVVAANNVDDLSRTPEGYRAA